MAISLATSSSTQGGRRRGREREREGGREGGKERARDYGHEAWVKRLGRRWPTQSLLYTTIGLAFFCLIIKTVFQSSLDISKTSNPVLGSESSIRSHAHALRT